jgi:hypothetical protein
MLIRKSIKIVLILEPNATVPKVRKVILVQECLLTILPTLVLIEIICEYDNGYSHCTENKEFLGHLCNWLI